jgi:hypothetical protein
LASYGSVLGELAPLIALTFALLIGMGVAMWLAERPMQPHNHESVVDTLRDGVYWAVVTMTTVGYGDKTPKTTAGRVIAVVWMLASVALISILSTSIVSRMTADRVVGGLRLTEARLAGKRLAAVAHSSGAEYLDERHLRYAPFDELPAALAALGRGEVDAVVNSVGALQYMISTRFKGAIRPPQGVLEPAYMAIALPPGSPLKKKLDEALAGSPQARSGARSRMAISAASNSHSRACLSAAAAAKGARAIVVSDSAHSARNGLRNGPPPPLAAEAAATPKISTGIVSGRTRIAIKRPPRLSETVSAAPIAPTIVSAGVPAASVAATSASGKGAIASMSPNSGLRTTSGSALAVQCAAHLMSTATSSGSDPLMSRSSEPSS